MTVNHWVAGSSPAGGAIQKKARSIDRAFFYPLTWARRVQLGRLRFRAAWLRASEPPQAVLAGSGIQIMEKPWSIASGLFLFRFGLSEGSRRRPALCRVLSGHLQHLWLPQVPARMGWRFTACAVTVFKKQAEPVAGHRVDLGYQVPVLGVDHRLNLSMMDEHLHLSQVHLCEWFVIGFGGREIRPST